MEKFSDDLENWMKNLPISIKTTVPIINLAIPGTHDSITYSITRKSRLAPDSTNAIRKLYHFVPCFVRKWAKTQKYSSTDQLKNGIRYFDLRIAYNKKDDEIYFVHSLYCEKIDCALDEMNEFLNEHPDEFILFDFQHFYDFTKSQHKYLTNLLLSLFNNKIYERFGNELLPLTLSKAREMRKQLIIIYRNDQFIHDSFFFSYQYLNLWPNVTDTTKLEEFLDDTILMRNPYQGFCSQLVLTPTAQFIIPRFFSSLRKSCAKKVQKRCKDWILKQTPGPFSGNQRPTFNVFLADFVELDDNDFPKMIIDLNMKLV